MLSFISCFAVRHNIYVEYLHKVYLRESSLSVPVWQNILQTGKFSIRCGFGACSYFGLHNLCFSSVLFPPTDGVFSAQLFWNYLPPRWIWMALTTENSSAITQIPKPNRLPFVHYKAHIIKRTCASHLCDDSCVSLFTLWKMSHGKLCFLDKP